MGEDFLSELDDIISDTLSDDQSSLTNNDLQNTVTVGHSVSTAQQTNIINDKIEWLADRLDIPSATVELAKSLRDQYRDQRGDLQGTALELVAASCLYCAAKVTDVPLDPTDFARTDEEVVTRKSLLRRSKDIANTVGLDPTAFAGSKEYVKRYCDELNLPNKVEQRALEIVKTTEESGLASGKSPTGWAGAAVYNACLDTGVRKSQSQISTVANVTEVTIRNRYQEQRQALRQNESLPADPVDAVQEVSATTNVSERTSKLAEKLLEQARDSDLDTSFEENSTLWALSALRRASKLTNNPIDLKSLSQYTEADSFEISSRAKQMRSVISQKELQSFRENHDSGHSEIE